MAPMSERVLSIQSHVVFGYVGGKAAVFPLQCLGYDVDVVNTVNFSNHAGYGRSGGSKTTAAELNSTFETMEENELLMPTRLLTGYIPGAEALSAIHKLAEKLKRSKSHLIYLLDPVMGDAGRLYVAPDVIPVYRRMLPLSTIITPNWFEVEILTDTKLEDLASLQRALKILHEQYQVPNVVITSIPLNPWLASALPTSIRPLSPNISTSSSSSSSSFPSSRSSSPIERSDHTAADAYILCISSAIDPMSHHHHHPSTSFSTVHAQVVPLVPGYFSGVGDVFSALLLAHFHPSASPAPPSPISTPLSRATSLALTKTHRLLVFTHSLTLALPEEERLPTDDELDREMPLRKTRRMRGRELALIKGQGIIRGEGGERREMILWDQFWELENY